MDINLTNRERICFAEVPYCDKLATKEKPRPVRQDRTRGNDKPKRLLTRNRTIGLKDPDPLFLP